jgi:hypothetical protein
MERLGSLLGCRSVSLDLESLWRKIEGERDGLHRLGVDPSPPNLLVLATCIKMPARVRVQRVS